MSEPDKASPARASFARRERHALCDLALTLGPSAPTLCEGWNVEDLVSHLVVRERRPHAAGGIFVLKMSKLTHKSMARVKRRPFLDVVASIRDPKAPFSLEVVERAANTVEWFVHHEDIRRAQPDWTRRILDPDDEAELFSRLRVVGRMLGGEAGTPLSIATGTGHNAALIRGSKPVTITGPASELALFLHGRKNVVDLQFDGPKKAVSRVRATAFRM